MRTYNDTHTPGPWAIVNAGEANPKPCGIISATVKTGMICHIPPAHESRDANARLIAACPKLLSALENLYARAFAQLDKSATHDGIENCKVLGDARAAIQEATRP